MKKFIFKLFVFTIPFQLWAAVIVLVDPFNYFAIARVVDDSAKQNVAAKWNHALWKSLIFRHRPADNVIFGDSRAAALSEQAITNMTGEKYYNFGLSGANLGEVIDSFWFAARHTQLKRVYFAFGLNIFHESQHSSSNRFKESSTVIDNPLIYVFRGTTFNAFVDLLDAILPKLLEESSAMPNVEPPTESKAPAAIPADPWAFMLKLIDYGANPYPTTYLDELKKISDYCNHNRIQIVFIIPPTHSDLRATIRKSPSGAKKYRKFKRHIRKLGQVFDFDHDNDFTTRRENFGDPYHPLDSGYALMIQEVWGPEQHYARASKALPH